MHLKITVYKMVEEDDYEKGCNGKCQDFGVVETLQAIDYAEALCLISGYKGKALIPTIFDDRLELSLLENSDGEIPSERETKAWKVGNSIMYCANYSFYISEVNSVPHKKLVEKFPQLDADSF